MGKFVDGLVNFIFGVDGNDGSRRQDRYIEDKWNGGHEHSWSKTSTDGRHKEGWHGSGFRTRNNRPRRGK